MDLILTRYGSIPGKGTFGELTIDGKKFKTIEREWLDNKPGVSCVPGGVYKLEPHSSRRFNETWALVSEGLGVYHFDHPNAKRTAILIHPANWQKDLQGCIGLGSDFGKSWNVINSRDSVEHVLALLSHEPHHTLVIKNGYNDHNRRS